MVLSLFEELYTLLYCVEYMYASGQEQVVVVGIQNPIVCIDWAGWVAKNNLQASKQSINQCT